MSGERSILGGSGRVRPVTNGLLGLPPGPGRLGGLDLQVVVILSVEPVLRRRRKVSGQPQRGVGTYAARAMNDLVNPSGLHTDICRHPVP